MHHLYFHLQEWQANQRERTKEWHAYRQKEEAEEEAKSSEYREIGMRMKAYPQEEVCKARVLVSSFIRAGEDVEKVYQFFIWTLTNLNPTAMPCFSPFLFSGPRIKGATQNT